MSTKTVSPSLSIPTVQSSFRELSKAATVLNGVSDKLAKPVGEIDSALKKLNLGVSAWVNFDDWASPEGEFYSYSAIGYAKISGKWGLAILSAKGRYSYPDQEESESWPFNEGPRHLRLKAFEHIPQLLEKLTKEAMGFAKKIDDALENATQLASAITEMAKKS